VVRKDVLERFEWQRQQKSHKDLAGKTFVETGASSGMGRSTALLLAQQGANVGLLDLHAPDAVAQEIEKAGGHSLAVKCNVQSVAEVDDAVKSVTAHFGGLHGEYYPRTTGIYFDSR
jgi:3-oxoacyl-[acyl-carrier protein] reductase